MVEKVNITSSTLVDFGAIAEEKKATFICALYKIYTQTEEGRDFETFKSRFYDRQCDELKVQLMKNKHGEWVGYSIIRRFMISYPAHSAEDKDKFCVIRTSVAILNQYRGQGIVGLGTYQFVSEFHQQHPNINIVSFNAILNPLAYASANKSTQFCFPSPDQTTPVQVDTFIQHLIRYFNYQKIGPSSHVICDSNKVQFSETDKASFIATQNLALRFFLSQTHLEPGSALTCMNVAFLTEGNSLGLAPIDEIALINEKFTLKSTRIKPPIEDNHTIQAKL